jgi:hypothetical protein
MLKRNLQPVLKSELDEVQEVLDWAVSDPRMQVRLGRWAFDKVSEFSGHQYGGVTEEVVNRPGPYTGDAWN